MENTFLKKQIEKLSEDLESQNDVIKKLKRSNAKYKEKHSQNAQNTILQFLDLSKQLDSFEQIISQQEPVFSENDPKENPTTPPPVQMDPVGKKAEASILQQQFSINTYL